ncbi:MAG: ABC transporter permease [Acidobacteria bacterium]|nr:ABC transporter permease [Acidobacteriota bacterium]
MPTARPTEKGPDHRKMRTSAALWEAFRIAVDSIWTHKLRSVLTLVGIIIAIASVVTVGGAIEGVGDYIWKQLSSTFASNTFIVARIVRAASMEEFEEKIRRNKNLYPEDMKAVESLCDGCEAISPMLQGTDTIKRGNKIFYDASISGISADLPKIQAVDLYEGRFIAEFDVVHASPVAVIGWKVREELFGPLNALGKQVKIGGDNFTVIGVEEQKGSSGIGQSADNSLYIPYTAFLKKYGSRQSISFQVRASSGETIQATEDEVRMILRARHKLKPQKADDFDMLTSSAIQETIDGIIGMIAVAIIPITLVGLVVGGIVVMNIMLVTVTERTVEVGMRKAVGARRADILLQFLVESALLATLGGVLGLGLAYVLCAVIEGAVGFPMRITAGYVLLAIFTSGGVGMVSGIYPAYRASKLSPIAALARE